MISLDIFIFRSYWLSDSKKSIKFWLNEKLKLFSSKYFLLIPLKTLENQRFSYVFRRIKSNI